MLGFYVHITQFRSEGRCPAPSWRRFMEFSCNAIRPFMVIQPWCYCGMNYFGTGVIMVQKMTHASDIWKFTPLTPACIWSSIDSASSSIATKFRTYFDGEIPGIYTLVLPTFTVLIFLMNLISTDISLVSIKFWSYCVIQHTMCCRASTSEHLSDNSPL